eukprot:Colp12_sorted_trinity150504_noHs@886
MLKAIALVALIAIASAQSDFKPPGYVGCFKDSPYRDLGFHYLKSDSMTPTQCQSTCAQLNYRFAGVQNQNECWCGKRFGLLGRAEETECDIPCLGDPDFICGGRWRNSVYESVPGGLPTGTPTATERVPGPLMPSLVGASAKTELDYFGCFIDHPIRDMPFSLSVNKAMTIGTCQRHCHDEGFKYAALQFGWECYCGDIFGRYGQAPENMCDLPCIGALGEICGGTFVSSIYAAKSDPTATATQDINDDSETGTAQPGLQTAVVTDLVRRNV